MVYYLRQDGSFSFVQTLVKGLHVLLDQVEVIMVAYDNVVLCLCWFQPIHEPVNWQEGSELFGLSQGWTNFLCKGP